MNSNKTILVTGANGQLGKEFRVLADLNPQYDFLFTAREDLAIENAAAVQQYFSDHSINFCINCAAYTAVDKAETAHDAAFLINATAVGNLAAVCEQLKVQLIHVSTDYVFDGSGKRPYKESDPTHPIGVYGQSKLQGEALVLQHNPSAIIIRTSWVYSSFGNNFVKTMLRLMTERESINVVNDQTGCPTYAADLAQCILKIIEKQGSFHIPYSIFNYCNEGIISWYEFALAIKELINSSCVVNPIPSSQYPTPAKRPAYSALNNSRIKEVFALAIPAWKDSLQKCLQVMP